MIAGDGEWHSTRQLRAWARGVKAPGFARRLAVRLLETLEAFGLLMHRTDIFLKDDWLRRCGTDHPREPAEGGRAPLARPPYRISCRSQKAFRRNLASLRSLMTSSRARVRSRLASSSTVGT